jgi:hypothetical protein
MELTGHIENGVVVFDGAPSLPEGTRVTVVPEQKPKPFGGLRPEVPIVRTGAPGTLRLTNEQIEGMFRDKRPYLNEEGKIVLTNEMIHAVFEEDDIRMAMGVWQPEN